MPFSANFVKVTLRNDGKVLAVEGTTDAKELHRLRDMHVAVTRAEDLTGAAAPGPLRTVPVDHARNAEDWVVRIPQAAPPAAGTSVLVVGAATLDPDKDARGKKDSPFFWAQILPVQ